MLASDLDLSDVNPDTVAAQAESGGLLPPGKYHARLEGAADRQAQSGNTGTELEFVTLAGPHAGSKVKDTVWGWSDDDDADRRAKTKNRYALIGHRLGLLTLDPKLKRYVPVAGKDSFGDCLGAEVVLDVSHRTYKRKDDGSEAKAVNVTFGGYYAVNDPKVAAVPKAKPEAVATATAPKPAGKPRTDVSEL